MDNQQWISYLKQCNIPADSKQYLLSFYSKFDYINKMNEQCLNQGVSASELSYGNYNSNVVFFFESHELFSKKREEIASIIEETFRMKMWWFYFMFGSTLHPSICYEMSAVKPKLCFVCSSWQELIPTWTKKLEENHLFVPTFISLPHEENIAITPTMLLPVINYRNNEMERMDGKP